MNMTSPGSNFYEIQALTFVSTNPWYVMELTLEPKGKKMEAC